MALRGAPSRIKLIPLASYTTNSAILGLRVVRMGRFRPMCIPQQLLFKTFGPDEGLRAAVSWYHLGRVGADIYSFTFMIPLIAIGRAIILAFYPFRKPFQFF